MNTIQYPTVTISLTVRNAADAIEFYKLAFNGKELYRLTDPKDGKIGHAEIRIGDTLIMLADEYPEFNTSPDTLGGSAARLTLMVDDADEAFRRAVERGATPRREPTDQFYGYRSGTVRDPFGHDWIISQKIESLSPTEMQRRWDAMR